MAINKDGPEITLPSSGDLSSYQFHIVTLNTSGNVKLAADPTSAVEGLLGILQNKPKVAGEGAVIRIGGVAKAMGGEGVAPGIWVTAKSDGHIIAASADESVVGFTLATAVSGEVHEIVVCPGPGYVAPT